MKRNVHFIVDEAAVLGKLEAIDNAITIGRGYSIRVVLIYQSIGQLRRCFPDGQDVTLLSNVSQVFFAANDNTTAEYVSARLGEQTIVLGSGGSNYTHSWQTSQGPQLSRSSGGSSTSNNNWQLQARKLLKSEEVMTLPQRQAITFTPGVRPICTHLVRSYEENDLGKEIAGAAAVDLVICLGAIARLVVTAFVALLLTMALMQNQAPRLPRAASPPVQNHQGVSYVTTG